jgi:hypothetical protein
MYKTLTFCIGSFLLLTGCTDPVNKTISEFKKTELAKRIYECGGLSANYEYNIKKYRQLQLVRNEKSPSDDESILVVKIIKSINGNDLTINKMYQFNDQSHIFKSANYFINRQENSKWSDSELLDYSYDDFCKDISPSQKEEIVDDDLIMKKHISSLIRKLSSPGSGNYTELDGKPGMDFFEIYLEKNGFVEIGSGIGFKLYDFRGRKLVVNYMPTGLGLVGIVEWE